MNIFRISAQELVSCAGKLCFIHGKKKDASGTFLSCEKIKILLSIPRHIATANLKLYIYDEGLKNKIFEFLPTNCEFGTKYDEFLFKFAIKEPGLYFAIFEISSLNGNVYANFSDGELGFTSKFPEKPIQITVSDFKYQSPNQKLGGVIYHIFVDRFFRFGKTALEDDSIFVEDWNAPIPEYPEYPGAFIKNNYFYGGTLLGIAEKLDYISSLGVDTIYLSPIFKAYSNHKYDTGNYMEVDPAFGGEDALKHLIKKAKAYDIGIILDGVFNHTGADSIYFNRYGKYPSNGAYQSQSSEYYDWFDFQSFPSKYTSWWGIEILPRINPDKKSCGDYFTAEGGVIEKYAKMGIDGFRLDVVDELSDSFIAKIKAALNRENKKSILYGEVWEDASNKIAYDKRKRYYLGDELDGVMNYPARSAIIDFIKNKNHKQMRYFFNDVLNNAPKRIRDMQMNLLGTHDTERILTVLGGESREGKTNKYLSTVRMNKSERNTAKSLLKMAYTILATIPGIPAIYYGDEAGIEGYSDPFNRRTYPWGQQDKEILSFYQKIGKIRKTYDVYKDSDAKLLLLNDEHLIFSRKNASQCILTVVNNSENELNLCFSKAVKLLLSNKSSKNVAIGAKSAELINISNTQSFNIIL